VSVIIFKFRKFSLTDEKKRPKISERRKKLDPKLNTEDIKYIEDKPYEGELNYSSQDKEEGAQKVKYQKYLNQLKPSVPEKFKINKGKMKGT